MKLMMNVMFIYIVVEFQPSKVFREKKLILPENIKGYLKRYLELLEEQTKDELRENKANQTENFHQKVINALSFFEEYCGTIIIVRDNQENKVNFPFLPQIRVLYKSATEDWIQDIPIGKPKSKIEFIAKNFCSFAQRIEDETLFDGSIQNLTTMIITDKNSVVTWLIFALVHLQI